MTTQSTHPILKEVKTLQKECVNEMKETSDILDDWCKKQLIDLDKKISLIQKEKSNLIGANVDELKDPELEHFLGNLESIPMKEWTTTQLSELLKKIQDQNDKLISMQNSVITQTEAEKNEQNQFFSEMENIQSKNLESIQRASLNLQKFQKYFGLAIEKVPGGAKFCFTKINKQNPKQIFYFCVVPLQNNPNHYQITECVPMVDYSETLNKFNTDLVSFQQFMVEMRILFCNCV